MARRLIRDLGLLAVKTASEADVGVFGVGLALGLGLTLGEGRFSALVLEAFEGDVFGVGLALELGLTLGEGRFSALVLEPFWVVVVGLGLALGLRVILGDGRVFILVLEALGAIVGLTTGVEESLVLPGSGFTLIASGSGCWDLQPVAKSSSAVMSQCIFIASLFQLVLTRKLLRPLSPVRLSGLCKLTYYFYHSQLELRSHPVNPYDSSSTLLASASSLV